MSATSVGRRVVVEAADSTVYASGGAARTLDQGQRTPETIRKDAMAAILDAIPSEGFATYLAIYGLVLTVFVDSNKEPIPWAAYGAVGVGAAINIFALLWAAGVAWKKKKPEKPRAAAFSLFWRVIAFTVLYGIVIISTPDNPFAKFAEVSIGLGLILVVVAGIVIGITKKP